MQTDTENPSLTTGQSAKVSKSTLDPEQEELALMQITLQRVGHVKGNESPAELRAAFAKWRRAEEDRVAAAEKAREDSIAADGREAVLAGLRSRLHLLRIDPAGMDEQKMRAKIQEAEEESKQFIEGEKRSRREEARHRRAEFLFDNSACPSRHRVNLDQIDNEQNRKWVETRNLLVDQSQFANGYLIALLGGRGVGKTQLAISAIHLCCHHLMTCRYTKVLDLFRDFRGAYTPVAKGQAGEREEDIIKQWASFDFLVIDECHQRGETAWEQNTLINLLDLRYDGQKCTVLIANQTIDEFSAAIGDSVVSRIHETGQAIICDWPTYRKPGGWKQSADAPRRIPSGEPIQPRATIRDV